MTEPTYKSKYICTLSPEMVERAKKELNEDEKHRAQDIEALRQWIQKEPHIHGRTDDRFLLMFLRNAKFSLETAKQKIDSYYTIRSSIPEWFYKQDPMDPQTQKLMKLGRAVDLGYDDKGRRLSLIRFGCIEYDEFTVDDQISHDLLYARWVISDEQTQICGHAALVDYDGTTSKLLMIYTPVVLKKCAACIQECIPVRLRKFYVWNTSKIFDAMFVIIKMFMKAKLIKRFWIPGARSNIKILHSQIPPKYLPTEYGGTAGDLKDFIDNTLKGMMSFREEILEERNHHVDESKRRGKPKTSQDILGIEGSFRKLAID